MGILTNGHSLGTSFCSKIPIKALEVLNNSDRINRNYCYVFFSVPNKCPLIGMDRKMDKGKSKCHLLKSGIIKSQKEWGSLFMFWHFLFFIIVAADVVIYLSFVIINGNLAK